MAITKSEALFKEAVQYIPGGVNSPVRAFGSIGSTPRFIKKADKALMWDEDDNEYIDFIGSWGPMILGHNHPLVLDAVLEYAKRGLCRKDCGNRSRHSQPSAELRTDGRSDAGDL